MSILVLNIHKTCIHPIIILDGKGFSKGAQKWLKQQQTAFLKKVLSVTEFEQQIAKGGVL